MEDLVVNKLFQSLNDNQRETLIIKVKEDSMLPEKLRNPDTTHAARGFHILMTRSN